MPLNHQEQRTTNQEPLPEDVVLSVRNVSKKFCRNLRRSMWYGIQDLSRNLVGIGTHSNLDPNPNPNPDYDYDQDYDNDKNPNEFANEGLATATNAGEATDEKRKTNNEQLPPLRRAEFWALQNISFDLKRGECLGLIGRNGCGKTTLLRIIAGIFPPDHGEIAIRGRDLIINI